MKLITIVSVLLLSSSCRTTPVKSVQNRTAPTSAHDLGFALERKDPKVAQVNLSTSSVMAKDFGEGFKVPSFIIERKEASYVQILRCFEVFEDPLANRLKIEGADPNEREWIWLDTFGNSSMCRVVSLRFIDREFQDIAAPDGNFFYLVNPCLSKDVSSTKSDICSFNLVMTNSVRFTGSPSQTFRDKAEELQKVEDIYNQYSDQILILVRQLSMMKERCEIKFQSDSSKMKWDRAMKDLITFGGTLAGGAALYYGARSMRKSTSSVGGAIGRNPGAFAASVALAAGTIAFLVRRAVEDETVPVNQDCKEAERIATEIQRIQSDPVFVSSKNNLASLSSELTALNKSFEGYDAKMMSW